MLVSGSKIFRIEVGRNGRGKRRGLTTFSVHTDSYQKEKENNNDFGCKINYEGTGVN